MIATKLEEVLQRAAIFGGILVALLGGLALLYLPQKETLEDRFDPGGSTICDEFMRSMPEDGSERMEAAKPCVEALPTLAPEDQLRIVNVFIAQLPDFIPRAEIGEFHTKLDPLAAMPFRAFTLRQDIQGFDEAQLNEATQLLADAEDSGNPGAIANAIMTFQQFPFVNGDINTFDDQAMERAVDIAEREGMFGLKPYLHNLWGLAHNIRGNYVDSIRQYQFSRRGFDANQDHIGIALSYINLSYVYADFQDMDKALEFANKSIEVLDQHDPSNVSQRLAGLIAVGEIFSKAGLPEEALDAFNKVSALAEKENYFVPDEIKVSRIRALYRSGETDAAMKEAVRMQTSGEISNGNSAFRELQVWLAARYAERGDVKEAARWFDLVKKNMEPGETSIAQVLDTLGNESFALEFGNDLLLGALASGNTTDGKELAVELDRRNKAHTESSIVNAIAGHELQENIDAMTVEVEQSAADLQSSRIQLALAALTAVLLGLFALQFYRTSKTQQLLAETRQMYLREIHHRTKNNLQVLTSVLGLDIRRADRGERGGSARLEAVNRVQMMGLIHDHVYNLTADAKPEVALEEFVDDLLALLDASLGRENVEMVWEVEGEAIDADRITPFGLLICELVTNAFKHAFGEDGGKIDISVNGNGDDLNFKVCDNGCGFVLDKALKKKGSIGMQLAFDLAEQAGGQLTVVSSPDGTVWNFA